VPVQVVACHVQRQTTERGPPSSRALAARKSASRLKPRLSLCDVGIVIAPVSLRRIAPSGSSLSDAERGAAARNIALCQIARRGLRRDGRRTHPSGANRQFIGRADEAHLSVSFSIAVSLIPLSPAAAVEKGLVNKGEVLVRKNCSRCHAIGKEGDSPHSPAPPFRTLSSKYPVENLAESLTEGIVSGHPDMPIFVFSADDAEAIVEHLEVSS
jgi:cytochrome c553